MKKISHLLFVAVIFIVFTGCELTRGPLRIGIKSFDEQRILAAMISMLIEQEGMRSTIVPCGDTYGCQRAIQNGDIDIMIEYTGTAINLGGITGPSGFDSIEKVRDFYQQAGLRWLVDIGFENDYVVIVPAVISAARGISSIPDLSIIGGDIKLAVHPAYIRRPGDGLYPLARRYGLTLDDNPLLIAEPNKRYRAVLEGRADVAVGFKTDGFLVGEQLIILDDPKSFFSPYRAGIIVSENALSTHPQLENILLRLDEQIGTHTMRLLNAQMQLQGRSPERIAIEFLRHRGIIDKTFERKFGQPELYVVSSFNSNLSEYIPRTLETVNSAFPEFAVRHESVYDPVESLVDGNARLALLGAEDFFSSMSGIAIEREKRIEAVSVVGVRFVHIVSRVKDTDNKAFSGRFGIVSAGSGSSRIGSDILKLAGVEPSVYGNIEEILNAVTEGEIDKALIVSEVPDPLIAKILSQDPDLELMSIQESWINDMRSFISPYLRSAQIPENSYPGQGKGINTMSSQVVLAAPSTKEERIHVGGLVSAVKAGGIPLTQDEAGRLLTAGIKTEMPDPVLPSPWSLRLDDDEIRLEMIEDTTEIILNILAVIYIIILGIILNHQLRIRQKESKN